MNLKRGLLTEFTMQSRLMTEEENRQGKKSDWCRVNLTGPIKNFPRNLCSLTYITTLVIKNNNLCKLPIELGNLTNLVNLDASHNRLEVLPESVGDLQELRILILNDNQVSKLPYEVGRLLNLRHLNLANNPLDSRIAVLYGDGSEPSIKRMVRYHMDLLYTCNAISSPPQRQWRRLDNVSSNGFAFTIMSYNVLSPHYATASQYPYCPSWALDWKYRQRSILGELLNYNANIICLQEVDTDDFEEFFKIELQSLKYDSVFLPKSRSRTMDENDCKKVDGCAIFWQRDKFEKVCEFHHEFMLSCSNVSETPAPLLLNRVMARDNVALGVVFQTKSVDDQPSKQFCVTTGHIHWDPEHSDVKMIQTIMWTAELWAYLDAFLAENGGSADKSSDCKSDLVIGHNAGSTKNPLLTGRSLDNSLAANMPVIMCGDFNSLPNSGVVEFLYNSRLHKTHAEFLDYGFKYMFEDWQMLEKWIVDGDVLRHRFDFDRAYKKDQGLTITNYTYDFKGMIDYVFFSRKHLRLLGSLDQVPMNWFHDQRIVGCPHIHIPSDHFPLLVELDLLSEPDMVSNEDARKCN